MRSRWSRLFVFIFLFGFLTITGALVAPDAEALGGCRCSLPKQTDIEAGYGFTCSEAEQELRDKVESQVFCAIGPMCGGDLHITEECHAYSPQLVEVKGYYAWDCLICWD